MTRRLLAAGALVAASFGGVAPASAYVCVAHVHGICVGPCGTANHVYRTATGSDLLYC